VIIVFRFDQFLTRKSSGCHQAKRRKEDCVQIGDHRDEELYHTVQKTLGQKKK
jgi:hypothetical protein